MTDVLFVCTANICRSAYADVRAKAAAPGLTVASAGVQGWLDHPMDETVAAEAVARGLDPAPFRSRRLQLPMIRDAGLILTAEGRHRTAVLDEMPGVRARCFTLGQLAALIPTAPADLRGPELVAWAAALRAPALPRDDVADPYRRGPVAASAMADTIDAHLAVILPRLT